MTGSNYTTTMASGITLTTSGSPAPAPLPKGVIVTRALELKDGWVGQVIIAELVVKEQHEFETAREAEEWATTHVVGVLRKLFK